MGVLDIELRWCEVAVEDLGWLVWRRGTLLRAAVSVPLSVPLAVPGLAVPLAAAIAGLVGALGRWRRIGVSR